MSSISESFNELNKISPEQMQLLSRAGCNVLLELPVVQQCVLSSAQGISGTRRWYFSGSKAELKHALDVVCKSNWPGNLNCLPVAVQYGAADEKVQVTAVSDINTELPGYDQYLIVAQYQYLHIDDPWPITGKPAHPRDTILALQVHGGAETLRIDPAAMLGGSGGPLTMCFSGKEMKGDPAFNSRIFLPLTEYRLICDRLTDSQLCNIMRGNKHWKNREGTVNNDTRNSPHGLFMNEDEGTLLFDSWNLDQTFAPDVDNPRRWRLSCILKCRQVPHSRGPYPDDCEKPQYAVGWNHDFKRGAKANDFAWRFIMLRDIHNQNKGVTPHGDCPNGYVPRYPYMDYYDLFCHEGMESCTGEWPPTCDLPNSSAGSLSNISGFGSLAIENERSSIEEHIKQIQADAQGVQQRKRLREGE